MADREDAASSEGEGEVIRPYGEPDPDRDSSDESEEDDPEEARRIAEGFIVDNDDDEEEDEDEEDEETRRRRRKERRKRKRRRERERMRREEEELSEDDLELLNENAGIAGPSRPLKRLRRRSGSDEGDNRLQGMFDDDDDRMGDDDDDLADFIEEDEDEEQTRNETEEQRRQRKREEKQRRRDAARARPELAGVDKDSWNEIFDVFGDGHDYDWALEGEEGMEVGEYEDEPAKKDLRLEDVFDPAEIKERRLQDEDRAIAQVDRPERHQIVNSTLSDNPIMVPDSLYPPPEVAAGWAYNRIGTRTQYLFCGNADAPWPEPSVHDPDPVPATPRLDLQADYIKAVATALNMMFVMHLEVPYLWHYKRDAFSVLENQGQSSVQFLDREDLWTLYSLGIRFRAIWQRCEQVKEQWDKIKARRPGVDDKYLTETLLPSVCNLSIEAAAEGADWLAYHYADDLRAIKEEEATEDGGKRLPERNRDSEMRKGPIMQLVKAFGINVPDIAIAFNVVGGDPMEPPQTPEKMPNDLAEEYCGEGTPFHTATDALNAAKRILVSEFARDPSIRQQSREFVEACALVSTTPTDRGMTVIDQYHAYYTFKFLTKKPVELFRNSPQFLHILKAEEEGLLKIEFSLQPEGFSSYIDALKRCVQSKDYSEIAQSWNGQREEVIDNVVNKGYIPAATRWLKEHMRTQAEEYVAERCREELEFRVNMRPYATRSMATGETPTVLAITVGQGTVHDAVIAVPVDPEGTVRSPRKFDNLRDGEARAAFIELIEKRRPDVVVIGGLSVQTGRLRDDAQSALRELAIRHLSDHHPEIRQPVSENFNSHEDFQDAMADFDQHLQRYLTPLIFVNDATARLYMNSEEAAREHPELPVNGRFALGLARYAQNPLNAYCRLGRRIADVNYVEHHQKLVSAERLLTHLERGLVNSVCAACLEVNSAVTDPYARAMVPFVAGLGPRKADVLVNAITKHGPLLNRMQLSEYGTFGPTIFENVAGFLCIDNDVNEFRLEKEENPSEQPEPLDMTRIHPEDYEFAQKMCQDALDLDAEDVADQHKSQVVVQLMQDADRERKLSELNLDDFAFNLQRQGEGNKRHTLGAIVAELISWRVDRRPGFYIPNDWEVLTMLTGETERTIGPGLRVTATVRRALSGRAFCQLETGLDAVLEREYVSDDPINSVDEVLNRGQAITAVILEPQPARFQVRISTRHSDLVQSQPFMQPFRNEEYNDVGRQEMAEELAAQKRRRKAGSIKRVVNHPNWHVMNSGQAEQFLAGMTRGDVVIRPSSKGPDHLAVTWKVDEDVYQHIDVQEIDKPHEHALGRILRIGRFSYSDLDDLIINHVKAIARKFDEMQHQSDKFKREDELESFLKNYVQAHPGRSNYGFSIDSDRPGYLKLAFLNKSTKDGGQIQTWPVKVLPGAYQLNNAEVPGVTELCNAFKAQYSSRLSEQGLGGKTPGIRAGGRTPGGRTPGMRGGATPYGGGRTPAYGGRTPMRPPGGPGGPPPGMMGGPGGPPPPPPGMPPGPPGGFGFNAPPPAHFQQFPGGRPPPPPPAAGAGGGGGPMNPERAAMIAKSNGGY